mmetsp:Transcript_14764/g.55644  ORF Transcript_14764/g.55644 Transcript_14764/m.55644 type:complete len:308 (+) Transcript_14764:2974-3897(+)
MSVMGPSESYAASSRTKPSSAESSASVTDTSWESPNPEPTNTCHPAPAGGSSPASSASASISGVGSSIRNSGQSADAMDVLPSMLTSMPVTAAPSCFSCTRWARPPASPTRKAPDSGPRGAKAVTVSSDVSARTSLDASLYRNPLPPATMTPARVPGTGMRACASMSAGPRATRQGPGLSEASSMSTVYVLTCLPPSASSCNSARTGAPPLAAAAPAAAAEEEPLCGALCKNAMSTTPISSSRTLSARSANRPPRVSTTLSKLSYKCIATRRLPGSVMSTGPLSTGRPMRSCASHMATVTSSFVLAS